MFPLTFREISRKIRKFKLNKISGLDEIFNRAFKMIESLFRPIFLEIFNIYIRLRYQPIYFKDSITVALRKFNKRNHI